MPESKLDFKSKLPPSLRLGLAILWAEHPVNIQIRWPKRLDQFSKILKFSGWAGSSAKCLQIYRRKTSPLPPILAHQLTQWGIAFVHERSDKFNWFVKEKYYRDSYISGGHLTFRQHGNDTLFVYVEQVMGDGSFKSRVLKLDIQRFLAPDDE